MTQSLGPQDLRQQMFREHFEKALPFRDYLATGQEVERQKFERIYEAVQLSSEQCALANSFERKLHILCLSGIWCGDCARQIPMLQRIAENSDVTELRMIDNREYPELADELRINGGTRVPVAVFLSEDFFEVARFGDRTLSTYREKASKELGAACDPGILPPGEDALQAQLTEWLEQVERAQLILRLSPMLRQRHGD